jgi:uncharacterized protein (TIGR03118 family)
MRTWFRNFRQGFGARRPIRRPCYCPVLERLESRCLLDAGTGFVQTALVSDIPGLARHTDPNLLNPWGISLTPSGHFNVAANNAGVALRINASGAVLGNPVTLPPVPGSPPGTTAAPTGDVRNTTSDFVISEDGRSAPATLLFSTEDGTIIGYNPKVDRTQGILVVDQSSAGPGAVYKGLALGSTSQGNFLYATNFRNDSVDVFNTNFQLVNQFTDPNGATGYAPFGIQNIDGTLFVTYAKQDAAKHDDVAGPGNGFIDEFDTSGNLVARFATGTGAGGDLTALNSPWGMAVAPEDFGAFGSALLVGNFGDSHVSAFNLQSGKFLGQLSDTHGNPLVLNGGFQESETKGLWGITFGNGDGGGGTNTLFFAAGINDEADGLFGKVNVAPPGGDSATAGAPSSSTGVQSLVVVPSPVINGSELLATAAIAANDIWAVGDVRDSSGMASTLAEHFDGTSWSVVPTPTANDPLVSVAASASNDVWAIGNPITISDSPKPFIAHWNGTSWSIIDSPKLPKNSFLTGVTAPASNNAWVVGNTFGKATGLVEHWDGTKWSLVSSPAFTNVVASAISADSSTDVWAFGLSNATGGPEALHFDGSTWTAIPAATSRFGFSVGGLATLSPTNVWAVGAQADSDRDANVPAAEHWDGTSWSLVSVPNPNPTEPTGVSSVLTGVAAVAANDIWAVGINNVSSVGFAAQTLTEHWDGTSWSIITSPNPGTVNKLFGVTALSDGTVAAVGFQENSTTKTGLILQNAGSAPKGKTSPVAVAAPTVTAASTAPTPMRHAPADAARVDPLFAPAGKTGQPSRLSGMKGLHVVSSPQIDGQLLATAAIADNDIWAVGFSDQVLAPPVVDSTLAEHWDGKSWSIVSTPPLPSGGVNPPNAQFFGVAAAASNDVWAVGVRTGPNNPDFGEQLIEHWNGTSWTVDTTGPTIEGDSLSAVTVVSSNNVWAVGGASGNALVEHWDGTSWSIVSNPVIASAGGLSSVSADSANDVWAVGQAGTGGPPILHFDGTNWTLVAPHPDIEATSVVALSPTNVWAVGTVGVFFNHRTHRQAAIEHWDGTSWSIVPSPAPTKSPGLDSFLNGITAISANNIWAVGLVDTSLGGQATLTEHWDGTSWKIINSPNPGNAHNGLSGATALSDGTVAAVGFQQDQGFDKVPLILQN